VTDSPIEQYLDALFVELRRTAPRDARSLLSETESHLRDAAAEAQRAGMSPADAESDAVRRYGHPRPMAVADRRRGRSSLARGVVASAWSLGVVARRHRGRRERPPRRRHASRRRQQRLPGRQPVDGPPQLVRLCPVVERGSACPVLGQAALDDWAWETVAYRIAFGVLGLVAFGMLMTARRRWPRAHGWAPLPATVVDTIATNAFGASGVWLAALGIDALIVNSGHGAGEWLSAAPVALVAGLVFGLRLLRAVSPASARTPQPRPD